MIIRYTVPEMWCETNLIVIFIWGYTFPFYPFKSQKNEKKPGDIIILHKCTKNHDQMLYCSWDMARVECYCYFSFREIFCPFSHPPPPPPPPPPLNRPKSENLTKWKIRWSYHHLTQAYQKSWSYAILLLRYGTWQM